MKQEGRRKNYGWTDQWEVEITNDTAQLLIKNIRLNGSLEEIVGRYEGSLTSFLEKSELSFDLAPVKVKEIFETEYMKLIFLTKSYRELGMNKSTLW